MENASKALLIAGGVLIAIILISMFLTMYNRIASSQRSQEEQKEIEQILAFNAEYEAYDKKVMYGADVITLMNKAIENNRTKNATTGKINYINIKVIVEDNFQSYVEEIIDNGNGTPTRTRVNNPVEIARDCGITISDKILYGRAEPYDLGTWVNGQKLEMDEDIIKWFTATANDSVEKKTTRKDEKIYYICSGLTQFKTSRFECIKVELGEDGRIKEMSFKQKK